MAVTYTDNFPTGLTFTTTNVTTYTTTVGGTWTPLSGSTWGSTNGLTSGGCTTNIFETNSIFDTAIQKWEQPDHFFDVDTDGACLQCPQGSMHRYYESTHYPIINEEPDLDDWRQLLAS